ncbi:MAG: hypothetical protein DRN12_04990 [Thermoplasmata archaeon]|nr:MAG: hypothetical protein DRN12_04990 [Thermoplasmata archaeon]
MAPDIVPITFYAWWGPFNISTLGIFIYYEIINNGSTIYSDTPITLNISILSNSTIIGYITQHPIFFPNIWYKGEKLGGSVFFESSLKPSSIRMIVDYNDSIPERNEDNNEINTSVSQGVIIKGYIIQKGKLCKDRVEIFQVDNESLSYSGFRRYYSNETGYYIATLPPISNLSQTYSLIAYDRVNKTSNLKTSPPLKPGETTMLNFTFSKTPGRPLKPLTLPIAKVDKPHIIIISSRYKTKIDWGDENYSQWITSKVTSHIWHKPGLYRIKIISINDDGMISEWSKPTPLIVVPKY